MKNKLEYLYELIEGYKYQIRQSDKSRSRQKLSISIVSIIFLTIYYIDFQVSEISFIGIKISNINFSKIFFLIPLIITFQFTYYIFNRLRGKIIEYRMYAMLQEIESIVKIYRNKIIKKHPYLSTHGTLYVFAEEDRHYSTGLKVGNTMLWLPVIYVFILGSFTGFKEALNSKESLFIVFYSIVIFLCLATVFYMQFVKISAFRSKNKK